MKRISSIGLLSIAVLIANLSGCGGGGGVDGGTSTVKEPVPDAAIPFASAAIYLASSQTSNSFIVSDCTRFDDSTAVNSATVVIQANGDMAFLGALGSAPITELARINFSETSSRDVYGNTDQSNVGFEVDYYKADGSSMSLYSYDSVGGFRSLTPSARYDCSVGPSTNTLSLQQPISQTRVVSNIVNGSTGAVQISPSGITEHTQTGSIVSWNSGRAGTFSRYISFNLDTAQFGQGNSLSPATHTPIAFTLPTIGSAFTGFYEEFLDSNGDKTIYFTHDNIDLRYRRYADPAANADFSRQFRMYSTADM
jgi:hypothetical protein